jgi:hypothetical protein
MKWFMICATLAIVAAWRQATESDNKQTLRRLITLKVGLLRRPR